MRLQGCTCTQPPNQDAPHTLCPPSRVLFFDTSYLTRDSTTQRVCSPCAGFNPPEFLSSYGLPVSCCLAASVVRSRLIAPPRSRLVAPPWRGPHGLPSPWIFMVLGDMKVKVAFVPSPSLGPWCARDLMMWCGLSCLVDLNSDLHCLCSSLHGPDTFWARGLS